MSTVNKVVVLWMIVIGCGAAFLMSLSAILRPFFIAFVISYLLQPVVNIISQRYKLPHKYAVLLVFLLFLGIFLAAITLLLPIIYQQIAGLINNVPKYNYYFQNEIMPVIIQKVRTLEPSIADKIKAILSGFISNVFSLLGGAGNNLWQYTIATINSLVLILLIPVILFYFLRDWPIIKERTELLLPMKGKNKIQEILLQINRLLFAYVMGQLNICVFLSLFYSVSLSIIGMDFAVLLGILSGFLIIIPFVGTIISISLALIVGYTIFGIQIKLLYILLIYTIGYAMESYILTPKIIGDKIGLHPVWIIFAVFACGSLFGFVGILFAIPIAGITKILLSSAINYYKSSQFYKS